MKLGIGEILVIFAVALVVLGPEKLPYYAQKLGVALREIRKVSGDLSKEIKENIVEPLDEAAKPLKEAIEPINDIKKEINSSVKEVTDSFNNIGKEPVKKEEKVEIKPEEKVEEVKEEKVEE